MITIIIKLNRYFSHIVFQLLLHFIFTIAFGCILSKTIQKNDCDSRLFLWGRITFFYNLIATITSIIGSILIEILLKKESEKLNLRFLMFFRVAVILSQCFYFLTCVAMAVGYSQREECSEGSENLRDLALAYTIIGLWFIILGSLYLISGHFVLKNFNNQNSNTCESNRVF